jgi:hypothetical protein
MKRPAAAALRRSRYTGIALKLLANSMIGPTTPARNVTVTHRPPAIGESCDETVLVRVLLAHRASETGSCLIPKVGPNLPIGFSVVVST